MAEERVQNTERIIVMSMGVRSLQRKFKDILYFTQKIYLKNHLNSCKK